jgi:hypothetical protein
LHIAGLLLVTHFTLLLGMAAPVWLSNAVDGSAVGGAAAAANVSAAGRSSVVSLEAWAGILVIGKLRRCL